MIFRIVATLFLAGVVIYAYSQSRLSPKITFMTTLLALGGEYFVLFPESAMSVAHFFGIGRGADLVFYVWILLSLFVTVNIYLKLRSANERFAALVRELSLTEAARKSDATK